MAVSRRTRYEVLRRDNHACRYCGAIAPDVKLTVDHVMPVALGGGDDPSNLVTACADCNAGKSSSAPDSPIVAQVAEDALTWAWAMEEAAARALNDRDAARERQEEFATRWNRWRIRGEPLPLPLDWRDSVDCWLSAGIPLEMLCDAIDSAMSNSKVATANTWRYMAGVAWTKIRALQEAASKVIGEGPDEDADEADDVVGFEQYLKEVARDAFQAGYDRAAIEARARVLDLWRDVANAPDWEAAIRSMFHIAQQDIDQHVATEEGPQDGA